ncbi:MAG TPA: hypothetical protein VHB20_04070 [Verrucomicrobiae bacterium]|jgi:hypothetical protein|nr:hypothetical protein [Verrucomicrobiae bacterium]
MSGVPKLLIIYAIAIPLAILVGFLVSAPGMGTVVIIGLLLFLFSLPFLLKSHHFLLILFWNSAFNVFFLPAQPHFWLLLAALSFSISWLNNIMGQQNFIRVPELKRPLVFLAIVLFLTAALRGGIGIHALGGESYGGKGYVYMLGAIFGYFALAAIRVPMQKAASYVGWFFLSGITFAMSNLVYVLGPAFYLLYLLVPPEVAISQAAADVGATEIDRIGGLAPASTAVICFLLARYGLRGILDWQKPWRLLLFLAVLVAAAFGGFRSVYLSIGLICFFQFFFEKLHRTIFLPICIGLGICVMSLAIVFASKLPLSAQRAISFLPVHIEASVEGDATGSWNWRLDMWRTLVPDIPKYFLLGKGYRIDPDDLYLAGIAAERGLSDQFEVARVAGDYHSGPLSLMISLGVFGVAAFGWIILAGIKVLHANWQYGPQSLRRPNTLLFSFFLAHIIFFLLVGDIRSDLFLFTGTLGLSVSINGGVARKSLRSAQPAAVAQFAGQMA